MELLLKELVAEAGQYTKQGKVAQYIPVLANANENDLAISICTLDGMAYSAGEHEKRFTMQSVSKVAVFICCLLDNEKAEVYNKVSLEPTNDGFNSIVNLETKNRHRPLNPMINSGAILCVSLVGGETAQDKFKRILSFVRKMAGNEEISYNQKVYESEKLTGSRNRALGYFMNSTKTMDGDVEEVLDAYFKTCSIEVTTKELARIALILANDGVDPQSGEALFSKEIARTTKAVMAMCGMYDDSGVFAVDVGLPSKSGVSGGIMSVVPGKMGIGVFGPALNEKGSSIAGIALLKALSDRLQLSIY